MPYKINKRDGKFCVIKESDGSSKGCHDTEKEAEAQMRALYASETKEGLISAMDDVMKGDYSASALYRYFQRLDNYIGNNSVSTLDVLEDIQDDRPDELKAVWTTAGVNDLPDSSFLYIEPGGSKDGEGKTIPRSKRHLPVKDKNGRVNLPHLRNAISRLGQKKTGRAWLSEGLRQKLLSKARTMLKHNRLKQEEEGPEGLIEKLKEVVFTWYGKEEQVEEDPEFKLVKSGDDWYVLTIFSNNYRDDDYPPEILSAEAHKDFAKAVNEGSWPHPELWYRHIPGTRLGEATTVHFDEETGMQVALHRIDDDKKHIVEKLSQKDMLVSHGMPPGEIRRDESDNTVLTRYRSSEVSLLPAPTAANKLTYPFYLIKETDMSLSQELRDELNTLGFNVDEIEALAQNKKAEAEEAGRESKEADTVNVELEAEQPEAVQQAEPVQGEDDAEVKAEEIQQEQAVAPPFDPTEFAKGVGEAIGEALAPLNAKIESLETELKALKSNKEAEAEVKKQMTPAASNFAQYIKSIVVGAEETRVDGRSSEAKDAPAQTEVPTQNKSGLPYHSFIDDVLSGKDWRESINAKQ